LSGQSVVIQNKSGREFLFGERRNYVTRGDIGIFSTADNLLNFGNVLLLDEDISLDEVIIYFHLIEVSKKLFLFKEKDF
jgi:hypothetical protein